MKPKEEPNSPLPPDATPCDHQYVTQELMNKAIVGEVVLRYLEAIHAHSAGSDVTHLVTAMLREVEEAVAARATLH